MQVRHSPSFNTSVVSRVLNVFKSDFFFSLQEIHVHDLSSYKERNLRAAVRNKMQIKNRGANKRYGVTV